MRRPVVVALVVGLAAAPGQPAPAQAHTVLLDSTPQDGDTVAASLERLVLVFDDEVVASEADVVVVDAAGEDETSGPPAVVDDTVEVPLDLEAHGPHRVGFRVVSTDGHPVWGDLDFTVTGAGATAGASEPGAVVTEAGAGGWSDALVWWIVAAAITIATLLRRRAARSGPET